MKNVRDDRGSFFIDRIVRKERVLQSFTLHIGGLCSWSYS